MAINYWISVLSKVKLSTMKISLIEKMIRKNAFLLLLLAVLISCDSGGDSDSGNTQNADPASPTMQPVPTNIPATQPPAIITPLPTAQPTITPSPTLSPEPDDELNGFQSQVLHLVNEVRAEARNCGSEFFPAASPVRWDTRIEAAALAHSIDMAQNQNFSHTGTDGSTAGDRLLMQGYNWSTWGENILVGLDNAPDAIDTWIGSPGHCSIIMGTSLKEIGAGVAQGIFQGATASYWTLLFATEN